MGLRALNRFTAFVVAALAVAISAAPADGDWERFKRKFMGLDGRVIDDGQGRISHSEGQGFGMLFAVHYRDRATFDRAWQWTRRNLQVRDDALLAWRWEPERGVTDRNNASDGDLLVAWALARAALAWDDPAYAAESKRLAQEVRAKLLRRARHGLVLAPGLDGFEKPEGLTINLSYWVFPALRELARVDPAPEWEELARSGTDILGYAYFGRWRLPPDWLRLSDPVVPAGPAPERFVFDAVRIPLYLLWSGRETDALLKPYREFWGSFAAAPRVPAWTNLKDDSVDSHGASQGIRAIAQAVAEHPDARAEKLPDLDPEQSYYSAVLLLLTKMALRDRAGG